MIRSCRGWWLALLLIVVVAPGISGAALSSQKPQKQSSAMRFESTAKPLDFVPGEVLVGFKVGTPAFDRDQLHAHLGTRLIWRSRHLAIELVRSNRGDSTDLLIQRYSSDPLVRYAHPNYIFHIAETIPNDTYFASDQWSLKNTGQAGGTPGADIEAPLAWDVQHGSSSVIVAVLDTGVKWDHPDLSANIWANDDSCTGGQDNDRNGYVDDCRGWDFVTNFPVGDNNPMDDNGHGTHVAGIIAATTNTSPATGIAGISWLSKIMPVKVFASDGTGTTAVIVAGIEYAVANGARIINYSAAKQISIGQLIPAFTDAIRYAKDSDVLFVCAAGSSAVGTDNDTIPWYPCAMDQYHSSSYPAADFRDLTNILCVTSTDRYDHKEGAANFGALSVDLGAPGVEILSTSLPGGSECVTSPKPGGLYAFCTGTSMATPHVAGVAALLLSQRPGPVPPAATFTNLKWSIMNSVDAVSPPLVTVTGGRLNANGALGKISDTSPPTAPSNLNPIGSETPSPAISLTWSASADNIGVHHYEVWRLDTTLSAFYTLIATPTSTSFADTDVPTHRTFVYVIYAVDAAGNISSASNRELGTTVSFTDPSLAGVAIKAAHVTQLRTAIGYARIAAGLSAYSWTDSSLLGVIVNSIHVTQLRTALDEARAVFGLSTGGYSDTSLPGVPVKAIHITELRTRVQ